MIADVESPIPQLCDVFELLIPTASDWQEIAVLLKIPPSVTEKIEQKNMKVTACLRAVLTEWLKQTNPRPSWNALAKALKLLGNETIAEKIRETH